MISKKLYIAIAILIVGAILLWYVYAGAQATVTTLSANCYNVTVTTASTKKIDAKAQRKSLYMYNVNSTPASIVTCVPTPQTAATGTATNGYTMKNEVYIRLSAALGDDPNVQFNCISTVDTQLAVCEGFGSAK